MQDFVLACELCLDILVFNDGTRGGVVGLGAMLHTGRSRVRFSMKLWELLDEEARVTTNFSTADGMHVYLHAL
jgi:hypothetical protein